MQLRAIQHRHPLFKSRPCCTRRPDGRVRAVASTELKDLDSLPVNEGGFLGMKNLNAFTDNDGDMSHLFEEYGDVHLMKVGPVKILMVWKPDHLYKVMNSDDWDPNWPEAVIRVSQEHRARSLTSDEFKPWRTIVSQVLSTQSVESRHLPIFAPLFEETVKEVVEGGKQVLWMNRARLLAFSVAKQAIIGDITPRKDYEKLMEAYEELAIGMFQPNFFLRDGIPMTAYNKSVKAMHRLKALLEPAVTRGVENREILPEKSILLKMITLMEKENLYAFGKAADEWPTPVTEEEKNKQLVATLLDEVIGMMIGGSATTAYSMAAIMPLLYKYPEWLKELNEEQDRVVAEFGDRLEPKAIRASPVALAFAQELVRTKLPIKSTYRVSKRDTELAGISIPAGVTCNTFFASSTRQTGPGNTFNPGHWLSEDKRKCKLMDDPQTMVFGSGIRTCPGKNLAMIELVTILAIVGRHVGRVEMTEEESNVSPQMINGHATNIPLTLHPRTDKPKNGAKPANGATSKDEAKASV